MISPQLVLRVFFVLLVRQSTLLPHQSNNAFYLIHLDRLFEFLAFRFGFSRAQRLVGHFFLISRSLSCFLSHINLRVVSFDQTKESLNFCCCLHFILFFLSVRPPAVNTAKPRQKSYIVSIQFMAPLTVV